MSKVIFLHGPPACGKLTIAKELARMTKFKLFHNHLTVDLLLSIFEFGSPSFVKHRQEIWLALISSAVREGSNLIFTFNPESTVDHAFPRLFEEAVKSNGGTIHFVEVVCPQPELLSRMGSQSRHDCKKLVSAEFFLQLTEQGAFDFPPLPSDLQIDSSTTLPIDAASQIVAQLGL